MELVVKFPSTSNSFLKDAKEKFSWQSRDFWSAFPDTPVPELEVQFGINRVALHWKGSSWCKTALSENQISVPLSKNGRVKLMYSNFLFFFRFQNWKTFLFHVFQNWPLQRFWAHWKCRAKKCYIWTRGGISFKISSKSNFCEKWFCFVWVDHINVMF